MEVKGGEGYGRGSEKDLGLETGGYAGGFSNPADPFADPLEGIFSGYNPNPYGPTNPSQSGGWLERALGYFGKLAANKGVQIGGQALNVGSPVTGLLSGILGLLQAKATGATDEQLSNQGGRLSLGMLGPTGVMMAGGELLGRGLQAGARALGFENMSPEMGARIEAQRAGEQNTSGYQDPNYAEAIQSMSDLALNKIPGFRGSTQSDNPYGANFAPDRR
jgi:hypothetical protein